MAEKPPERQTAPMTESEGQRVNRALAEAAEEAEARQADEMPDGGKFMVDGELVDANGEPIKGKKD